jgi:hypothetical protein
MMGGTMVPEDLKSKVALKAISCATQLRLVVVDIKGKLATRDMHLFVANPTWSQELHVWGKAGVVVEGKDSKTGNRDTTMIFAGYAKCNSDSL